MEELLEFQADPKDLLYSWRQKAWDRFLEIGPPHSKQEAFQYVPLAQLKSLKPASRPEEVNGSPLFLNHILFANGFFERAHLPKGVVCHPLDLAMRSYGIFLQSRFARMLKEESDPFAVLNGALHGLGAFLYVPPNVQIQEPIEIHHHFSSNLASFSNLQIFLGKGASVQLIQRSSHEDGTSFGNCRIDVSLDEGAHLFLGDKQRWPSNGTELQTVRATLKRNSRLHYFALSSGAKLSRSSIKVQLLEENSSALLQGLWTLDGAIEAHTHVVVEHIAPNCQSRQHFKGILKDRSRSSFEGKILVRPEAQKTEAYQLNNNLLLSDAASAYTKPNLEIFADDVKASHGATIAQLQEEELFYLRSRGLSVGAAKELLTKAFGEELLASAPLFFQKVPS